MVTFERVKQRILRDMAASKSHDASSWARIMLTNTNGLNDINEQHKFWEWISNPEDEDRPVMMFHDFEKQTEVEIEDEVTVPMRTTCADDEKESETVEDVTLLQDATLNGMSCYIKVKPRV